MSVINITGHWDIKLTGQHGELKQHVFGKNVICDAGKEALALYISQAINSATINPFKYIAIGTGSTPETAADTALVVETARVAGTASFTSGSAMFTVYATFPAGTGTGAITEYGVFNTSSAGIMFSRDTEAVVNKGGADTLTVITQVTLS